MTDYFEPARLRIERARLHSDEMSSVWNQYLEPHPFDFELVRESDTRYLFRVTQYEPFPSELPLIFGEWLYNLRSALDYSIWAAAVHGSGQAPPPGERGLQYPIYDHESAWTANTKFLAPLTDSQRDHLLTMQPFNSDLDANYLGWINRLARIDRHRRLAVWTARLAEMNPVLKVPCNVTPQAEWGDRVFRDRVCDFIRFTFPTKVAADGVTANPRVGIDPEIAEWGESPFWAPRRFSERILLISLFVQAEVAAFQYDCTGDTNDPTMLADAFRQDSDARRASSPPPPITVAPTAPVEWKPDDSVKRATARQFRGEDFPADGPGDARQRPV